MQVGSVTVLEAGKDPSGSVASVVNDQCSVYLQAPRGRAQENANPQTHNFQSAQTPFKSGWREIATTVYVFE